MPSSHIGRHFNGNLYRNIYPVVVRKVGSKMKHLKTIALSTVLVFSALPAYAHDEKADGKTKMENMSMSHMMGMHEMVAKVTAINAKTGLIDVDSAGLKQHLHFPPTSLAGLNVGDKITLHLSYTKP